jgi:hypothetical protein
MGGQDTAAHPEQSLLELPGLEFPNYIVTGGNNALLYQNGEDINKTFDSLASGSVYTSMLG